MWWRASNCSSLLIYRLREDERLSWPGWLTYSGRLTHIIGHPSASAGRRKNAGQRLTFYCWAMQANLCLQCFIVAAAADAAADSESQVAEMLCHQTGNREHLTTDSVHNQLMSTGTLGVWSDEHWTDVHLKNPQWKAFNSYMRAQ